jgi:hypothetical protein
VSTLARPGRPRGTGASAGRWRRVVVEVVVVLVVFAVLGAAAGYLWTRVWSLPEGVVQDRQWFYLDFPTYGRIFSATATYVVIGALSGLVLGVVAAFACRSPELVVLAAVALGSVLAAVVAHRVGVVRSPVNPQLLALVVDDGSELRGRLTMPGRSPYVAWPLGALLGLGVTYLMGGAVHVGVEGTRSIDERLDDRD